MTASMFAQTTFAAGLHTSSFQVKYSNEAIETGFATVRAMKRRAARENAVALE